MNGDAQDNEGVDIGKKHKLGHLRIDPQGKATFKHLPTNQLVEALQLGIQHSVAGLEAKQSHDILFQDFGTVQIVEFPKSGSSGLTPTPPHRFSDFTIRSYAPKAFRHFREKFNIRPEDYLSSIIKPFRELKNPGASGSLFYLTADDEFIIKTVEKKEAEFLKTLLPGYYMNIMQNPRTLLPKFFDLYCYQGENRNIRIMLMNNLIPSDIHIHEKYDLKGSTYKRRANEQERQKESPTWKDLDFIERHPQGLILDADTYTALKRTVERDCRVLESFHIMDYSFLMGIHCVDIEPETPVGFKEESGTLNTSSNPFAVRTKRMAYSTPMDTIQAEFDGHNTPEDENLARTGGIPALTAKGERLYLYVGIIDILQSYQIRKKLEHGFKSLMTDGTQISVTNPKFYSERFQKFLFNVVFKKAPQRASKIPNIDHNSIASLSPWTERGIGPPYAYINNLNHTQSSPSTVTTSSRATSNYASSRQSDSRNKQGSSTTLFGSSHPSDSLYGESTQTAFARIVTSSFNKNDKHSAKLQSDKDLSNQNDKKFNKKRNLTDIDRKYAYSTTNIPMNSRHLSNHSSKDREEYHQSSEEVTRL